MRRKFSGSPDKRFKRASHRSDHTLALKKIICQSKEAEKEAIDEARVHDAVDHPNVLPCVAWDIQPSDKAGCNQLLLLFPFYPAGTVFDIAWAAEEAGGAIPWPFPEDQALRIFLRICRGLQAFHKAGYVHRDVKPHSMFTPYRSCDLFLSLLQTCSSRERKAETFL